MTFESEDAAEGITANPRLGIDPEIEEWSASPFWKRVRFSERLHMMHVFLYAEVGLYEYDCTGASAHEAMTDEYKIASDRRRAEGFFPKRERDTRSEVQWEPAGAPKASSKESLLGLDFPRHGVGAVTTDREDSPSWGVQFTNEWEGDMSLEVRKNELEPEHVGKLVRVEGVWHQVTPRLAKYIERDGVYGPLVGRLDGYLIANDSSDSVILLIGGVAHEVTGDIFVFILD